MAIDGRREHLISRIGWLWRGDWTGTEFDGRDGQEWLDTALHGDEDQLDDLEERLDSLEQFYLPTQ